VLAFLQAHVRTVRLLDAVATPQTAGRQVTGPGRKRWEKRYDEYLDVLHRHRLDVATFLVKHGKETPEIARQAVASLIGACWRARQDIDRVPWAYLDLARIRDAVAAAADPIGQALRLYREELEERLGAPPPGPDATDQQQESAPPPEPAAGEIRDGRVYVDGTGLRLTPQLRKLLSYLLRNNGIAWEAVARHMGYDGRPHLESRLSHLRNRIAKEGRRQGLRVSIQTAEGLVTVTVRRSTTN
jgi:hypothetical protein